MIFSTFLCNSGLQKVQLFRHTNFKNQCFLPSVTVLSQELVKALLSHDGLYFCCSCDCFSDEHKERFFPVWTDVIYIYVLAQKVSLFWCIAHKKILMHATVVCVG